MAAAAEELSAAEPLQPAVPPPPRPPLPPRPPAALVLDGAPSASLLLQDIRRISPSPAAASPGQLAPALGPVAAAAAEAPAGPEGGGAEAPTPGAAYRSAAIERIKAIFSSGGSRGRAGRGSAASGGGRPGASSPRPSLQAALSSSMEEMGSAALGAAAAARAWRGSGSLGSRPSGGEEGEEGGSGFFHPGSVAAWSPGGFYTPVARYIEYRRVSRAH